MSKNSSRSYSQFPRPQSDIFRCLFRPTITQKKQKILSLLSYKSKKNSKSSHLRG